MTLEPTQPPVYCQTSFPAVNVAGSWN